jgi:hypothetical protein
MAHASLLLKAAALAAALHCATAIFGDAAGVDDRTALHAGPLRLGDALRAAAAPASAAASGGEVVVPTDASVVAALDPRTGAYTWRAVLPDGACPPHAACVPCLLPPMHAAAGPCWRGLLNAHAPLTFPIAHWRCPRARTLLLLQARSCCALRRRGPTALRS